MNASYYARKLEALLDELKREHPYREQDAMLVLKDVLYQVWKSRESKS